MSVDMEAWKLKWKSRTFYLAIIWTALVPLSIVANAAFKAKVPLENVVLYAGLVTLAYVGGEKAVNALTANRGGAVNGVGAEHRAADNPKRPK